VKRGSLTVVGTGIAMGVHLTPETRAAIESADEFLHLSSDLLGERWLLQLHPRSTSLRSEYVSGEDRRLIYERIVERILGPVRAGARVAAAFYGHPGVYVTPSHEAVRRARAEGHEARMLPAISAEDCLYSDLGVDPASGGCASYDATEFLIRPRPIDTSISLILWQICVIGNPTAVTEPRLENLPLLVDRLLEEYPREHEIVVYEASPYPIAEPVIQRMPLHALSTASITPLSTLYVPPATVRPVDSELAIRVGFSTR
jgi:uncharacterized protein YabN with tetrapyrrole methylase and pyrophosphatase domain